MKQKNYMISVLGTQNPIGQALLAELERQNYPADRINPLDLHQEAGSNFTYHGQTLTSAALDLFDITKPHILFLCDTRIFDRYPHHFLHGKNWLIDCTGRVQHAKCIIPHLNIDSSKNLHTKCLCAPCSAAIALASALVPLDQRYGLIQADVTAVMGAWYYHPKTADTLITQTRQFFTQTGPQKDIEPLLAFNLIPSFYHNATPVITRQMKCFVQAPVNIQTTFAPTIRGGAFFVRATFNKRPRLSSLSRLYAQTNMCHILPTNQRICTNDLLSEDKIFIQDISCHQNEMQFWILQDALQTGNIRNTVRILSLLTK